MILRKDELEGKLGEESAMIKSGELREENPLDQSDEFNRFLLACRRCDLRKCQELISQGVNINGKDRFDYTPLIIASLCGHYELVQLLLESGALAERNTFQGERCIYNALNDRIRNLLLEYDFSKTSDPYVYWSTHMSSLLTRTSPRTSDISLISGSRSFGLHKFLLAARTPYFRRKLEAQPDTSSWNLASSIPVEALQIALRFIYLGDLPRDLVPSGSSLTEEDVARGLDKISKQLEIEHFWETFMTGNDRRLARQRFQDEEERALEQFRDFFESNVLRHKLVLDTERVNDVKWSFDNPAFADVLLRADDEPAASQNKSPPVLNGQGISIGLSGDVAEKPRKSTLYPVHKAILIRSEYFEKMFSGEYVESQRAEHLRIVTMDFTPAVLELVLTFLYTENAACPLEHALDLLYAADMLFLDSLKSKAAQSISTLGNDTNNTLVDRTHKHSNNPTAPAAAKTEQPEQEPDVEMELINIYDVVHAAWDLRVRRLEEFAARYLAFHLEDYIDDPDFQELIRESADRIQNRQETDTIELLDDIRHYLSERFRFRFADAGIDEMMADENPSTTVSNQDGIPAVATALVSGHEPPAPPGPAAAAGTATTNNGSLPDSKSHVISVGGSATTAVTAAATTQSATMRTLDGTVVEDEFDSDAINYQLLVGKIDAMLERLNLDA
ncbi:BTB/POZ fold protein [Moelleriella libera RCEF 2490]|uniref:BTB/POZ fold protein n=1 Tax=Moelleriella libera RCEF 2490 TaxID=1081109 RepID=A0A168EML5_9HYPO|nr:BTB/POZ fold protein [Moelleriella libera RCEF 2490]